MDKGTHSTSVKAEDKVESNFFQLIGYKDARWITEIHTSEFL
jgi:hypothetical protein